MPVKRPLKILSVLAILVMAANSSATLGLAATIEEESVEKSTASASATTENLKNRIEKIVDEKREQIKGVLSEFDQRKRGILGNVTRVSEESVTIKTTKTTEIIPINDSVELLKAGKSVKPSEVAVNDWLVVMGLIENDTFAPKRILISSDSLRPPTPVVTLGTIETINRSDMTIVPRNQSSSFEISTDQNTVYEDINGEQIDRADIEEETQALIVGFETEDNERQAKTIRILTVINRDEE